MIHWPRQNCFKEVDKYRRGGARGVLSQKKQLIRPPAKENRHQRMMKDLRNKKRNLKRQLYLANFNEKEGLLKIWQDLKEKSNTLSREENQRKRRVKWRKEQGRFFQEPLRQPGRSADNPSIATNSVAWGTEPGFSPFRVIALGGKTSARET